MDRDPRPARVTGAASPLAAGPGGDPAVSEHDPVLVIDYGAQYSQLIARRVRECRVYAELVPHHVGVEAIAARRPRGIILSGGPSSVHEPGAPAVDPALFDLGVPVLGICYGMQAMAVALGGRVGHTGPEFGKATLDVAPADGAATANGSGPALLAGLPASQQVWMSHHDAVDRVPDGFAVTGSTAHVPVAAMEDRAHRRYAVQYHPEVGHTTSGLDLLKAFLYDACDLAPTWTPVSIVTEQIAAIRAQVGDAPVICGLSGGVDSAVAAMLVHRAVGDQLTCVFVDHGLMRADEGDEVERAFADHFRVPFVHVHAEERFLGALAGVADPEEKRRIIGREFIRAFEREARALAGGREATFLVQGTLYSDVVESGGSGDGGHATIKSHHNVGGLPEDLGFALVEPLRHLFKDEVRAVGAELGLPDAIVWRQPFPGPGLAIRIIGDVTQERLDVLRAADRVLQDEIRRWGRGLARELWQAFCVLPAIRSVGVQGDARTYAYPIVIRAVTSDDAMTADWARLPYDLVERISSRIIAEVPQVNRVALDVSSKPPATIEWE